MTNYILLWWDSNFLQGPNVGEQRNGYAVINIDIYSSYVQVQTVKATMYVAT